ncbi:related to CUTINASE TRANSCRIPTION FACTOR 1 BETA [Phialocephala subalpina]|uniref:Related to CUTINASE TRANSCRIPTION FACTOR 1 BETA n=1 Tax=Phialocephala subalpina TaxID=576137 RepID=A0A1L7WLF7_9HELO|nr:related to CUTINASE TRANSCRIPTION FACTOR 1 BETA [Phialocephala subalpina]
MESSLQERVDQFISLSPELIDDSAAQKNNSTRARLQHSFRKPRAGRACGIRCDAGSHGLPCTNCAAFSLECSIPPKKPRKRDAKTASGWRRTARHTSIRDDPNLEDNAQSHDPSTSSSMMDKAIKQEPEYTEIYAELAKKENSSTFEDSGRMVYLGEMTNMSIIVNDYQTPGSVHYEMPTTPKGRSIAQSNLEDSEINFLQVRGALILPPRDLCDELIRSFFIWVAPIVPIVNQKHFMKRYHDPGNPPSVLLMQTMMLAGSRVCTEKHLLDAYGSETPAATLFYQRAKALHDADYEKDRVAVVQSLILMGWYWEEPSAVTKSVFYWNALASSIAQGFGMHRSAKNSRLSNTDQRLWKRIWWTLFTRDRSIALALGRPIQIHLEDSDVDIINVDDFIDEDGSDTNWKHVLFFLEYVKLCRIMDDILLQHYSTSSKDRHPDAMALTRCDMALAEWLENCPQDLRWDPMNYDFWSAYLHCVYQTTSCTLHRAYLPSSLSLSTRTSYSHSPAFESAQIIVSLTEILAYHQELCYTPPFMIYSLLSALMVQIYQVSDVSQSNILPLQKRIETCMDALEDISNTWLVAKMVHTMFEAVLGSAELESGLRKVAIVEKSQDTLDKGPLNRHVDSQTSPRPARSRSESLTRATSLTPSLVDHMEAALQSATTKHPLTTQNSRRAKSHGPRYQDREKGVYAASSDPPGHWKSLPGHSNHHQLSFSPDNYHMPWNDPVPQAQPAMGLNTDEWFQFFGLRPSD